MVTGVSPIQEEGDDTPVGRKGRVGDGERGRRGEREMRRKGDEESGR